VVRPEKNRKFECGSRAAKGAPGRSGGWAGTTRPLVQTSSKSNNQASGITVAVGTTIADRPPPRSVRARLRIRLLRRMSSVEASVGIGVQNAGWRNPPGQDWGKTFPAHLCALTTADQNTLP
jgi:hypothetical protein